MYKIKERIAIARIMSDMIRVDNIIEESEIAMLNRFKVKYDIDSRILTEARHVKFSRAVRDIMHMDDKEKIKLFEAIQSMALVDGHCVPKEAMLLLALRYALGIERSQNGPNKYCVNPNRRVQLISCPTGETSITNQYVVYIEGSYNAAANENVTENFELNVLNLRQWGFDFIYIPSLIEQFKKMNTEYVKDVIAYMAPELSDTTINVVYDRLFRMDTVSFCNHVLADKLGVEEVRNAAPSLLINIGTSVVPYCSVSGPVECYTEFMCIPLDNDVYAQIHEFIRVYSRLVSFYAVPSPTYISDNLNRFKYFGFYKAMFDFLVMAEPKESDLVIHPFNNTFEFPQIALDDLVLSPQEAALYKLILEYTYNHPLKGLPKYYTGYEKSIANTYRRIYMKDKAELPENLAPIRSRIAGKMRKQLSDLANVEQYIPKLVEGKYVVSAPVDRIKVRERKFEQTQKFEGYKWK